MICAAQNGGKDDLVKELIICDTHCDTISIAYDKQASLYSNNFDVNIKRMKEYKNYMQFFAAFIASEYYKNPMQRCLDLLNFANSQIQKYSTAIELCKNSDGVLSAWDKGKAAAVLSVEGGECIQSENDLNILYDMGVRMVAPAWNNDNMLAGGALGSGKGLSEFGKRIVSEMNKKGIICDVSHLCERSFYDVCSISDKPIVASHSNSYEICTHRRNLKKEQFKEVMNLNGVVGINMYCEFLTGKRTAEINDILRHIEYFLELGGEDNICMGSDFDGIDAKPGGIESCSDIYKIFDALEKKGIPARITEKIAYKNILRVMGICL